MHLRACAATARRKPAVSRDPEILQTPLLGRKLPPASTFRAVDIYCWNYSSFFLGRKKAESGMKECGKYGKI